MAHPSLKLITALKVTASKISASEKYQWGHMGSCNCGNLAQELTEISREDIHNFAMQGRGDWREQLEQYCPSSGMPIDLLISDMLNYGLTTSDLQHLEWLNDPKVLRRIPLEKRDAMHHNVKADVVFYINEWAQMLEEELVLDSLEIKPENIFLETVNAI